MFFSVRFYSTKRPASWSTYRGSDEAILAKIARWYGECLYIVMNSVFLATDIWTRKQYQIV